MAVALRLYDQLSQPPDGMTQAWLIAESLEKNEAALSTTPRDRVSQESLRKSEWRAVKEKMNHKNGLER